MSLLGAVYAVAAFGTVIALGVLSSTAPALATQEAWGHAIIVAVFAVVLLLRVRSARSGNARATRAVGIIATVLIVVNVVEAALPGVFPPWMRVAMLLTALLLLALLVVLVVPRRAAR
ncbi:hypothetical protein WEH80_18590 [Actinomycetes bacterium KLBMP 9759]